MGFTALGTLSPAAHAALLGQALALAGADGKVIWRLALKVEIPRLFIGRSDLWSEEAGPFRHLGPGRIRLSAVHLHDLARTAATEATGRIALRLFGEDDGLGFIHGAPTNWASCPLSFGRLGHSP